MLAESNTAPTLERPPQARVDCGQCGHSNRSIARYCGWCGVFLVRCHPGLPVPLRPGELIGADGRYRIDRPLGGGGFGHVFLAEDTRLDRLCAIKQLHIGQECPPAAVPQIIAAFAAEARMIASLTSPGHRNLPEVYDQLDDRLCLVMKYVAGESLATLIARRAAPLPEDEALRYARDVCSALAYMHARTPPVLHRDLKPANLIRDTAGNIVLIDFGLASPATFGAPLPLAQAGTSRYAPLEQRRGTPEPRSDVYALGATLYQLLTCVAPSPLELGPPPPIRQVNPAVRPEVEALVLRALSPAPLERPSAAELLAELEELLERRNIPPPEPEHPPLLQQFVGRGAELAEIQLRLGQDRALALVGMPGAGKTTLAATLAARHPAPARVFWHSFRAGEGVDVLIWRLASWLAHAGRPDAWQRLQGARQSGGPPLSPELLVGYLIQQLRGWGDGLLCLDDLQLADDPALLRVIGLLADAARQGGLALLATARTVPNAARLTAAISLGGLAEAEAVALLEQAGLRLDQQQAAEIARATEGNPQFLTLAINALRRGSSPAQLLAQLSDAGDLGSYLLREVDAGLSGPERKLMQTVALFQGHGGSQAAVSALLGGRPALRGLAHLVERHLLGVEQRADGSIYRQHAIVQGFYYAGIPVRRRKAMHAQAGDYYAGEGGDQLAAGRHFALADQPARVAAALSRDIWELINAGHAREARALLGGLPFARLEPGLRAEARSALGEIGATLGEYAEARALLDLALAENPTQDVRQARRHRALDHRPRRRLGARYECAGPA